MAHSLLSEQEIKLLCNQAKPLTEQRRVLQRTVLAQALNQEIVSEINALTEKITPILTQACAKAIELYGKELFQWLLRRARTRDEADDLYQIVCENVLQEIDDFEWRSSLRTWIYRIAFFTLCHRARTSPVSPLWESILREASQLARQTKEEKAEQLSSSLKRLHKRIIAVQAFPESIGEEEKIIQEKLQRLISDTSLASHLRLAALQKRLSNSRAQLIDALYRTSQKPTEYQSDVLLFPELKQTSESGRLDKRQKLFEAMSTLSEHDQYLIAFRQVVDSSKTWEETAKAWLGYPDLSEDTQDTLRKTSARLRQRFSVAMKRLREEAVARGLSIFMGEIEAEVVSPVQEELLNEFPELR